MESTPPPLPALDPAGRLADDLPCIQCAYNLRGLGLESTCPECGAPVGRSASGDLLQFADPRWLNRIAQGMEAAIFTLVAGVFCVLMVIFIRISSVVGAVLALCVLCFPVVVGFVACLLFTTPEPRDLMRESRASPRRIARWSVSILMLLMALTIPVEIALGTSRIAPLFVTMGLVAATVSVEAAGRYAASLARRIPDLGLAKEARIVGHGCAAVGASVTFACLSSLTLTALLDAGFVPDQFEAAFQAFACVYGLGALVTFIAFIVFGIWTLALILRFCKILTRIAGESHATWAKEMPGAAS